jgi:hypothetical protein
MTTDPHAELKREEVARVRRLHEQAVDRSVNAQDRANRAAGSPDTRVYAPSGSRVAPRGDSSAKIPESAHLRYPLDPKAR